MQLTHLGISYFRSIGEEPVTLDLTKKINVLVGANNCGKSNVLRAVEWILTNTEPGELDHHLSAPSSRPTISAVLEAGQDDARELRELNELRVTSHTNRDREFIVQHSDLDQLTPKATRALWSQFSGRNYPGEKELGSARQEICSQLLQPEIKKLKACKIPEFRRIERGEKYDISGIGIVELVGRWQQPQPGGAAAGLKQKFVRIRDLLRSLIEDETVTIDSTAERDQLTVERNGQLLPLSSYGTGIHELIILAIAVLQHDKAIVCIEEPEIHLHPLLQRRFIEFLRNETTNRYVITTHSPALITPHKETAITHLWLDEKGVTRSRPVETTNDGLSALHDLGAQASDLLQANSVIWVEGPSDRIYLRRWLELLHPGEFTEGIDYTIMFYGGRLLSHLSLERDVASPESEEQEADELIQLLRINQHAAILIDSDRRKASDELNPTKRRVIDEATQSKVFCWVTEGREIENYLPVAAISAAYSAESGQSVELSLDQFETLEDALKRAFTTVWPRKHYYEHAKAQWARAIAEHMTADHLTPHLRTQLAALVAVIQHPSPSLSPVHPA